MPNYDVDEDQRTSYDKTTPNVEDALNKADKQAQLQDFLKTISQIESSGGTNLNHPTIQTGLQAGQQAIGQYGLLPNTVQELTNRARLHNQMTPEMQAAGRNPASLAQNPQLEQQYAQQLAQRVLDRTGDPNMAAYAWNSGHNLTPEQIKQRDYINDPYVQKFQRIWKSLGHK